MKPSNILYLPQPLLESFLWDCDLYYDDESSRAETIHDIGNGCYSSTNDRIMKSFWKNVTEEDFQLRLKNEIENTEQELLELKKLLS